MANLGVVAASTALRRPLRLNERLDIPRRVTLVAAALVGLPDDAERAGRRFLKGSLAFWHGMAQETRGRSSGVGCLQSATRSGGALNGRSICLKPSPSARATP